MQMFECSDMRVPAVRCSVAVRLIPEDIIDSMARYDRAILEAALAGYQAQARQIEAAMADLGRRLGSAGAGRTAPAGKAVSAKRHGISAEGRARIAEAQRKRWAAAKKTKA
jgi:hypothetical protein